MCKKDFYTDHKRTIYCSDICKIKHKKIKRTIDKYSDSFENSSEGFQIKKKITIKRKSTITVKPELFSGHNCSVCGKKILKGNLYSRGEDYVCENC